MKKVQLLSGEIADKNAPQALLEDGRACIPQHYLKYQHTITSVEELILKLEYCDRYPIFVSQDALGVTIQIGIIGADNYSGNQQNEAFKIVYGRKWRIEPQLPSAEIVQTVFLAIKKAREHEVRELFRLTNMNKVTTPFNGHHDLIMLINSKEQLNRVDEEKSWQQLQSELDNIRYDHASFHLLNIENRYEKYWLVEIEVLVEPLTALPELRQHQLLVLVLDKLTLNVLCYQLMAELIRLSDRHVDEHFMYLGVARFSQKNDIKVIANISANTRGLHKLLHAAEFEKKWRNENYLVDLTRVPHLRASILSERIKGLLNSYNSIDGILPNYR